MKALNGRLHSFMLEPFHQMEILLLSSFQWCPSFYEHFLKTEHDQQIPFPEKLRLLLKYNNSKNLNLYRTKGKKEGKISNVFTYLFDYFARNTFKKKLELMQKKKT